MRSKMAQLSFAATFLAMQLLVVAESSALVLCTTPDGKTYAGDTPPADCKVKSEYTSSEPPTPQEALETEQSDRQEAAENAFDAKALSIRRQIERLAQDAAEELKSVRQQQLNLPVVNPAMYENSAYGWQRYEEDLQKREMLLSALRQREAELMGKIGGARQAFGELTEKMAKAHGGIAPASWAPMRCDGCP
jgi:hypothetical protein